MLHRDNTDNSEIVFVKRKGLKNEYKDKLLAALPIYKIKNYAFTSGESKTNIVKNYIESQLKTGSYDEEKLKGTCIRLDCLEKVKRIIAFYALFFISIKHTKIQTCGGQNVRRT